MGQSIERSERLESGGRGGDALFAAEDPIEGLVAALRKRADFRVDTCRNENGCFTVPNVRARSTVRFASCADARSAK